MVNLLNAFEGFVAADPGVVLHVPLIQTSAASKAGRTEASAKRASASMLQVASKRSKRSKRTR